MTIALGVPGRIFTLGAFVVFAVLFMVACASADVKVADLPPGDAARGQALFTQSVNGAPPCMGCHGLNGEKLSGPPLNGYGKIAGNQVAGLSAGEFTLQSITRPAAHITEGYSNLMYTQYGEKFSKQQLSDLVAWLLTQ
jgi:cytochrome c553